MQEEMKSKENLQENSERADTVNYSKTNLDLHRERENIWAVSSNSCLQSGYFK